ncbi:hypothetical protein Hbl1158_05440 [Halobaculum sp. CBA1158]|uniref:hypothetical protein n=1 Tax=Halobaculum sp. CBA1158 TaxID=2904243 RepID=UPI001F19CA32|nr:hypothetical protein [Halobaculum sp. CBA1158]UIP00802.1 hypothetical protein Hbl1158_05440 [Halobaculum sp. CBA1158]
MSALWGTVAAVAVAANLGLLLVLLVVWGRNAVRLRSSHAIGLSTFAALLFAENAIALYYYLVDPTLSAWFASAVPPVAWRAMVTLHLLETVALAALIRITLD